MMWGLYVLLIGAAIMLASKVAKYWRASRELKVERYFDFFDHVRDPDKPRQQAMAKALERRRIDNLKRKPAPELIRLLLNERQASDAYLALRESAETMGPDMVAALRDPDFRRRADNPQTGSTPLGHLLGALSKGPPPEAADAVAELLEHPNSLVSQNAAAVLGATGTPRAMELLEQTLRYESMERVYAMIGIRDAIASGRLTPTDRAAVFDTLVTQLFADHSHEVPKMMLALDRGRAIDYLTSEYAFAPDATGLQHRLRALREAGANVAAETLLDLIHQLEERLDQDEAAWRFGEALKLLAATAPEQARPIIRRVAQHESGSVRESAMEAEAVIHGVDDPSAWLTAHATKVGWDALTDPQRRYLAIDDLSLEVCNGGFAQYFLNSSGDHWRDALTGLETIGAENDMLLLEEAVELFGSESPSEDQRRRHRQLAQLVNREGDDVFDHLHEPFFADQDDREDLLLQYAIANAEHFRKPNAPKT